jgi:hypothetical protein
MATHWAAQYIGREWINHEHDCWAFTRLIQKTHFDCDLPFIDIDANDLSRCVREFKSHPERSNWLVVDLPIEGDVLLMSQNKLPTHIGVWLDIDGGGVLHCIEKGGVIFTKRRDLSHLGYNLINFYRHKTAC